MQSNINNQNEDKFISNLGASAPRDGFHNIPARFTYRIYIDPRNNSSLLNSLTEYVKLDGNMGSTDGSIVFSNGLYTIYGVELFVKSDEKEPYKAMLYFTSREEARKLENEFIRLYKEKEAKFTRPIYTLTRNGWYKSGSYDLYEEKNYLGYQSYIKRILKDADNLHKHSAFLDSIGEGNRSLNYLLYGAPGTGKTTLVKIIANQLRIPIYNVKGTDTFNFTISQLLTPKIRDHYDHCDDQKTIIVLFEDFDRNITENRMAMDDILNALDGIQNSHNIIRFFTGNNCDVIFRNAALTSRFNYLFGYETPTADMMRHKLYSFLSVYTNCDKDAIESTLDLVKINLFMDKISAIRKRTSELSLRTFANYVKLYIFNEDTYLDDLIANVDALEQHNNMKLEEKRRKEFVKADPELAANSASTVVDDNRHPFDINIKEVINNPANFLELAKNKLSYEEMNKLIHVVSLFSTTSQPVTDTKTETTDSTQDAQDLCIILNTDKSL
jgi:SpoVK/Ycf46/Vps4 family AAA+-type ATPase